MQPEIGVITELKESGRNFHELRTFDRRVCQLVGWNPQWWTPERAENVRAEAEKSGVHITAFWAGWSGPAVWDFESGPTTLGIVPEEFRKERVQGLKKGGDFARWLGVPAVITHLGFIPENPSDPQFERVVHATREVAAYLKSQNIEFWFETGQETPITMLRLITSVGTDNLGINLDPANLIPCTGTTHADYFHGEIPCAEMLTDDQIQGDYEKETATQIIKAFTDRDYSCIPGVLVAGHGPFTWGPSVHVAVFHSYILEYIAEIGLLSFTLSGTLTITISLSSS